MPSSRSFPSPVRQLPEQEPGWYAIHTHYKREKQVVRRLCAQGVVCYLPLLRTTRYYTRKTKVVELPLLPRYAFVQITREQYAIVLQDRDVPGFVRTARELNAIPEQEMTLLRRVAGDPDACLPVDDLDYRTGDRVELIGGELTGVKGHLVHSHDRHLLCVALESIGCGLYLKVPADRLRLLQRAAVAI